MEGKAMTRRKGMDRREFVTTAGVAAAAAVLGPTILIKRSQKTLKIIQWSHFVPAYDAWFDKYAKDWGTAKGVEVTVDHISLADLTTRANAEVAAQHGDARDAVVARRLDPGRQRERGPEVGPRARGLELREAAVRGRNEPGGAELERRVEQSGPKRPPDVVHPQLHLRLSYGARQQAAGCRRHLFRARAQGTAGNALGERACDRHLRDLEDRAEPGCGETVPPRSHRSLPGRRDGKQALQLPGLPRLPGRSRHAAGAEAGRRQQVARAGDGQRSVRVEPADETPADRHGAAVGDEHRSSGAGQPGGVRSVRHLRIADDVRERSHRADDPGAGA